MNIPRSMAYYFLASYNTFFSCRVFRIVIIMARAVDVFVEMADYEVAPDTYTFSSLASAYAKLGDASSALETLSTMVKNGIKPNRFTCSSVMQVRCFVAVLLLAGLQTLRQSLGCWLADIWNSR